MIAMPLTAIRAAALKSALATGMTSGEADAAADRAALDYALAMEIPCRWRLGCSSYRLEHAKACLACKTAGTAQ